MNKSQNAAMAAELLSNIVTILWMNISNIVTIGSGRTTSEHAAIGELPRQERLFRFFLNKIYDGKNIAANYNFAANFD